MEIIAPVKAQILKGKRL